MPHPAATRVHVGNASWSLDVAGDLTVLAAHDQVLVAGTSQGTETEPERSSGGRLDVRDAWSGLAARPVELRDPPVSAGS